MRAFRILSLVAVLSCSMIAQSADFETCAPGPVVGGCAPEIWTNVGGTLTCEPDLTAILGPTSGFPTLGNQWMIASADLATGFLAAPGGGPAPYPFIAGDTADIVFPAVTLGSTISFDWNFVTPECANDLTYNDFFTVDIVDPSTGLSVANILYRDTFSTTFDINPAVTPDYTGIVPTGFCNPPGALEEMPAGAAKTMVFAVPAALIGQTMNVEFHVGNSGDDGFSSYAYLDNIQLGTPAGPFAVTLSSPLGAGSLQVDNTGLTAGTATYNIFTLNEPCPGGPGTGPLLGLCTTNPQFLIDQFNSGVAPFAFLATGPTETWGPIAGLPSGIVLECVSFEFPGLVNVSPVAFHIVP